MFQNKEQIKALDTREERLRLEECVSAFSQYEMLLNESYKHFSVWGKIKNNDEPRTLMQTQLAANQNARTMLIIL